MSATVEPFSENRTYVLSELAKSLDSADIKYFRLIDYLLFALMLLISTMIGVYYGFISKRKQNNRAEYILGNQEMSIIPIAASLTASHVSGITMLALPADIYANGTQYAMCFICMLFVALALIYIYIPVFYELNVTSMFTYLEKRFDRRVKATASLVYALACVLYIPVVIYIPALAFNQVSGINLYVICGVICCLCIFYTTVGGLRAVVWSDTIQFVSIIGAIAAVAYYGTAARGGFSKVLEAADRGGRLIFFNMDPNPFMRMSFWTISVGMSTMWISLISANQSTIQRCLALPSLKKVTICVITFSIGVYLIKAFSVYSGLLLYAEYENCDPVSIGAVKKLDQLLPYYAMRVTSHLPGVAGIFMAGVFAAALSSMSTTLNSLSGTIFEDLIKPFLKNPSEKKCSDIMKGIVVSVGVLEVTLVMLIEKLGAVLHLSYSLHGLTSGTLLGIFTIGMFSRKVNTKGVVAGSIASLLIVSTILIGAQSSTKPPTLQFNTDDCYEGEGGPRNFTDRWQQQVEDYSEVPQIFRLSFLYYGLLGAVSLVLVAYPVSIWTGGCEKIDEKLLVPFMRSKPSQDYSEKPQYETVDTALKNLANGNSNNA